MWVTITRGWIILLKKDCTEWLYWHELLFILPHFITRIFLLLAVMTNNSQFWIGLTDAGTQMQFRWTDGSPVTYTNWAHGEPNNWANRAEDCVTMHFWPETQITRVKVNCNKVISERMFNNLINSTMLKSKIALFTNKPNYKTNALTYSFTLFG